LREAVFLCAFGTLEIVPSSFCFLTLTRNLPVSLFATSRYGTLLLMCECSPSTTLGRVVENLTDSTKQATRPEHRTACGGGIRHDLGAAEQPNPATTLAPHRSKLTSRSWLAATVGDWFPCVRCLALSLMSLSSSVLSRCKTLMDISCFRRSHCCMAAIRSLLLLSPSLPFQLPSTLFRSRLSSVPASLPFQPLYRSSLSTVPASLPFPPLFLSSFC
jgi:hypothetical protein